MKLDLTLGFARFVPTLGSNAGSTLDSSYSGRNRLVQHKLGSGTTARYAYNAFGERVAKWVGAEAAAQASAPVSTVTAPSRQYAYDEGGHLIGEYDGQGALIQETLWLDDAPVVVLKPASAGASPWGGLLIAASTEGGAQAPALEGYFVEVDQLDTPRAIVNGQGTTVWRWEADPFGDTVAVETPSANAGITTPFGYSLRFPGQVFDGESGVNYNYFRDYEAATGRYTQSDPLGLLGGLGTFGYAKNSPGLFIDRLGLKATIGTLKRCNKPDRKLSSAGQPKQDPRFDDRNMAIAATHVEGQAALLLDPGEVADLEISHPTGPCGFCTSQVPDLLPPGAKLNVTWPNGSMTIESYLVWH